MSNTSDRRGFLSRTAGAYWFQPHGQGWSPPAPRGIPRERFFGRDWPRSATLVVAMVDGRLSNDQGILLLPHGFQLRAFGAIGDLMSDGNLTPIAPDGMGAFAAPHNHVRLVRIHEDRNGPTPAIAPVAYDRAAGGGTTR